MITSPLISELAWSLSFCYLREKFNPNTVRKTNKINWFHGSSFFTNPLFLHSYNLKIELTCINTTNRTCYLLSIQNIIFLYVPFNIFLPINLIAASHFQQFYRLLALDYSVSLLVLNDRINPKIILTFNKTMIILVKSLRFDLC